MTNIEPTIRDIGSVFSAIECLSNLDRAYALVRERSVRMGVGSQRVPQETPPDRSTKGRSSPS